MLTVIVPLPVPVVGKVKAVEATDGLPATADSKVPIVLNDQG